ncbi:MAG: hypothetical protein LBS21_11365 [Clostridiales bacterium]|nr:hypothetical protein [Clostridiales bacterium]
MGWYREAYALVPENYGFRRGGLFYLAVTAAKIKRYTKKGFIIGGKPRLLAFISKYFSKTVPYGETNAEISERINSLYADTGSLIEKGDTNVSFTDSLTLAYNAFSA